MYCFFKSYRDSIRGYIEFLHYVYGEGKNYVRYSVLVTVLANMPAFMDILFIKFLLDGLSIFDFTLLFTIVFVYAIYMLLIPSLTNYISTKKVPLFQQELIYNLKKNIFSNVVRTDLRSFDDAEFLDSISFALQTVENQGIGIVESISMFISMAVNISVLVVIVSTVNPVLFFLAISAAIITYYYGLKQSKQEMLMSEEMIPLHRENSYYQSIFTQRQYAKELRIYGSSILFDNLFSKNISKCINVLKKRGTILYFTLLKTQLFRTVINVGIIVYLIIKANLTGVSIGNVVAALSGTQQLSVQFVGATTSIASLTRYGMIFSKYKGYILPSRTEKHLIRQKNVSSISFQNVSFKYEENGTDVLSNISFTLEKGKSVAFAGKNGAGKTSLLKLICGFYSPTEGRIYVDGVEIKEKEELMQNCTALFQDFVIYNISVAENILMRPIANYEKDIFAINEALSFVGLKEKVCGCQKGIWTIISKEYNQDGIVLSEGERQRLAIARLYVQSKPVIVLDEITSALDYCSEKDIVLGLKERFKDSIVIWVSHRSECLKNVDEVLYLENGIVTEQGQYDYLLNINGRINVMYDRKE